MGGFPAVPRAGQTCKELQVHRSLSFLLPLSLGLHDTDHYTKKNMGLYSPALCVIATQHTHM